MYVTQYAKSRSYSPGSIRMRIVDTEPSWPPSRRGQGVLLSKSRYHSPCVRSPVNDTESDGDECW
jgi:hypothetical protein